MLNEIIIPAFIKDYLFLIKKNDNYFKETLSSKKKFIKEILGDYPASLSGYMLSTSVSDFEKDLSNINNQESKIYKVCLDFSSNDLPVLLDNWFDKHIPSDKKILNKTKSFLLNEIKEYFKYSTFKEASEYIAKSLGNNLLIIEIPVVLDYKSKFEYRQKFLNKKDKQPFVEFVVNPNLIGGMRILENEHVYDYSWYQKVVSLNKN